MKMTTTATSPTDRPQSRQLVPGGRSSCSAASRVRTTRNWCSSFSTLDSLQSLVDHSLLGSVTFGAETPSGWQTATFPTAVAIAPNTDYVISYHTDVGNYAATDEIIELAQPSVSHHLKQLTDAELIIAEKEGREVKYTLNNKVIDQYVNFLTALKV